MPERKVPLTMSRAYAFSGSQDEAIAEAQRVGKRDFDLHPHVRVDIRTDGPHPSDDAPAWVITVSNGNEGMLKVPTDWPTPSVRPDAYTSDGNPYDGE